MSAMHIAEAHNEACMLEVDVTSHAPAMAVVMQTLARAACTDAAVLLRGPGGAGKSALARWIHAHSPRREQRFVLLNCPTLSVDGLTQHMFQSAPTVRESSTASEGPQGGTVFLDEVADLSPQVQAKLLHFLQNKEYERLGGTRTHRADVRVLTATQSNLEAEVEAGRFRQDLFYRLNVVEVTVPSLQDRRVDILPLAERFLAGFARDCGRSPPSLSAAAAHVLQNYSWPGNIRELRNVMERVAILWPESVVQPAAFPERMLSQIHTRPRLGGDFTVDAIEAAHANLVIERYKTLEEAATVLGVDASTLWRKRKKWKQGV